MASCSWMCRAPSSSAANSSAVPLGAMERDRRSTESEPPTEDRRDRVSRTHSRTYRTKDTSTVIALHRFESEYRPRNTRRRKVCLPLGDWLHRLDSYYLKVHCQTKIVLCPGIQLQSLAFCAVVKRLRHSSLRGMVMTFSFNHFLSIDVSEHRFMRFTRRGFIYFSNITIFVARVKIRIRRVSCLHAE